MATQSLEFGYTTGQTLTAKLFAIGSDDVAATADSVIEATEREGRYVAEFEDVPAASYLMVYYLGGTGAGSEKYVLTLTTATFQPVSEALPAEIASAGATATRTELATELARIDVGISTRSSHSASDVAAQADIAALIAAWADGGRLDEILDAIGAGVGSSVVTVTVQTAGAVAIEGARVSVVGTTRQVDSSALGKAVFNLDDGSYTLRVAAPSGYADPSDTALTVDGSEAVTITLTATGDISPPDNPLLSTVSVRCVDEDGANEEGVTIAARLIEIPSGDTGVSYDGLKQTATSDANGVAQLTLVRLAKYQVWRGSSSQQPIKVTVADVGTQEIVSFIGVDA